MLGFEWEFIFKRTIVIGWTDNFVDVYFFKSEFKVLLKKNVSSRVQNLVIISKHENYKKDKIFLFRYDD